MVAAGGVTANPGVGSAGAAIFVGGWTVGRVAGAAGSAVTIYQYNHNLNGTNGTDMYVSWGTTVAGLNPEWSAATSTINLVYTAVRTAGVEVPNIPWIFPRKE